MAPHNSLHERSRMRWFASLTAVVAVLAIAGLAEAAGRIFSPAIFGGTGNSQAFCAVYNAGRATTAVALTVYDESGNARTPLAQFCNGVSLPVGNACHLAPRGIFWIQVAITPGAAYACTATGSAAVLRGMLLQSGAPADGEYRSADLR